MARVLLLSAKSSIMILRPPLLLLAKPSSIHGHHPLHASRVLVARRRWPLSALSSSAPTFHLLRASQSSDLPGDSGTAKPGPVGPGGGGGGGRRRRRRLPMPNLPTWAKCALGSIVCLTVPYLKKALTIEDAVEKVAETATTMTETIAEVTEKVAADVADVLPDGNIKQEILEVEKYAEEVDKDAKKVEEFIHKLDHIKEEIEAMGESIINAAEELTEKESKEKKNTTSSKL